MSKYKSLLKLGLSLTLLATGCSAVKGTVVSEDNAVEAAIDDTGFTEKQVTDIQVNDNGDVYSISFHTPAGIFNFEVNKDGTIKSKSLVKENEADSEKEDQNKEAADKNEEKQESSNNTESENKEPSNTAADNTSAQPERQEETRPETQHQAETQTESNDVDVVTIALNNVGVTRADVTQPVVTQDGDFSNVTFDYGNRRITVVVDRLAGKAVSTFFDDDIY